MGVKWTSRRERVWSDARTTHKMGWLDEGVEINVVEVYQGWSRFDRAFGANPELLPFTSDYKEYWITSDALNNFLSTPGPTEDSAPEPPSEPDMIGQGDPGLPPLPAPASDQELGAAIRTVLANDGGVFFKRGGNRERYS